MSRLSDLLISVFIFELFYRHTVILLRFSVSSLMYKLQVYLQLKLISPYRFRSKAENHAQIF